MILNAQETGITRRQARVLASKVAVEHYGGPLGYLPSCMRCKRFWRGMAPTVCPLCGGPIVSGRKRHG